MNDDLPKNDARLLHELTRETRNETPPEIDFDRLEASLYAAIDREPVRLRPRRGRTWVAVTGLVAVAAAGSFFYLGARPGPSSPIAVTPPPASIPVAARTNEHVEAGAASRSFTKAGLATWVLEPGAIADVTDEGERVVVALASGAIHVDVVPQPVKERFVVIVDHTRVAVHGTSFRVARSADRVDIDVEHGVVAVGALDSPARWMMNAPLGGTFRVDATAGDLRALVPFTVPVPPPPAPPRYGAVAPSAAPSSSTARIEKRMDSSELRAKATALTSECFARSPLPADVHVTVETSASLVTDASGAVTVSFDPPLAPGVEACVRDGLRAVKSQPGTVEAPMTLVGRK